MSALARLPIRQIAYFCTDVREAAMQHHRLFGSGPYFVADNIPLRLATHRGREATLDHSSAYGQWGELMVEFVQQNNAGPSAFHDMYPEGSGRTGLHHVALFVDDLEAAVEEWTGRGFDVAFRGEMNDGFAFYFIDTVALYGHMIELYEQRPQLTGFYDLVRKSARDWDGRTVITTINFD